MKPEQNLMPYKSPQQFADKGHISRCSLNSRVHRQHTNDTIKLAAAHKPHFREVKQEILNQTILTVS